MFYTLMERGMLKKIKIYIRSGCRVGLYTNKQISYQRQLKVIASLIKNSSSKAYIKQLLSKPGLSLSYTCKLSSAKDILFICSIQFLLVAMPNFQFGRVESNIGHMVMAKGGSTIWILLVKFLECKLGADPNVSLWHVCQIYSTF